MRISLIIPVYNVEKYIIQCLESVVPQLSEYIEVILVNDGSPDNSMSLVNEYIDKIDPKIQKQIKIINQKNKGLSGARNTGIDHAEGEYIAFLDSDDILYNGYFDALLNIINEFSPDIVEFDAVRFGDNGENYSFYQLSKTEGIYEINEDYLKNLCNQSIWYAWKRIYNKKLFTSIRYPVGVNFEDIYTTPYLFIEAKTIYLLPKKLIGYRVNASSITNTKSEKNLKDLKLSVLKLEGDVQKYPFLLAGVVSMSRIYIYDVFKMKGFFEARREWQNLKNNINLKKHLEFKKEYVEGFKNLLFLKSVFLYIYVAYIVLKLKEVKT
ncbi:glycosyltransferase family 2 protein [Acinetobacter ursingii]|uniref:Glycosyltransferase 2-like domain-containing protein n=1 Tax=Acinetobacter ursingii TaxID=108980 RepID=A0A3F3L1B7_9GAMM|nr:glycosyltransferase [Acinetobacter ursingii]MCH2006702.1 glycosyltransferase [Acinetobacter ursingii]MCH2014375.1 glycosyltransferase [Acinetobacter ursingii]MCU4587840.1 glycosyltransferase [Acinetobacter ursingii]PPZ93461.1 hypothetical protein C5B41_14795 [Acinetobacter ursingii]HCK31250.1 hypothetical protein [Acinetobacter ursingii]